MVRHIADYSARDADAQQVEKQAGDEKRKRIDPILTGAQVPGDEDHRDEGERGREEVARKEGERAARGPLGYLDVSPVIDVFLGGRAGLDYLRRRSGNRRSESPSNAIIDPMAEDQVCSEAVVRRKIMMKP